MRRGGGTRRKGATLYVTLEPCCTHGRTPPCTDAIIAAGIKRVVVGAVDPNPKHAAEHSDSAAPEFKWPSLCIAGGASVLASREVARR